ncbi:MAG: carbohydrate kinase family protein [Chloroflexota bacterium]
MMPTEPSGRPNQAGSQVRYVALGGLRTDFVITAEGEVILNQHGGNAIYSAAGMRLWADGVGLVGRVGCNFPDDWLHEARAAGLDLSGVRRLPTWQETRTFYAYLPDGCRQDRDPIRHFASLGRPMPAELEGYTSSTVDFARSEPNPLSLTLDDFPSDYLTADGIHLAPYDLWTHSHLAPALSESGPALITLDPNYGYAFAEQLETVCSFLPYVTAFLPSELEAQGLLGPLKPAQAAQWFVQNGARCVVVKLGGQGSLVLEAGQGRLWRVPAYPARVQDLTGAGDVFCGGFLVGYAETGDPVRAAQYGTVSASFAIESRGGLATSQVSRCQAEERLAWLTLHRPPQPC